MTDRRLPSEIHLEQKERQRMLINVHCHIGADEDVHQWHERHGHPDLVCTVVCGDWDKCEEAMRTFPDRVIALGRLSHGSDQAHLVDQFHDRGFKGLKMISLPRPYDDPAYYPVYEKAARYEMPILFHTGHLALSKRQVRGVVSHLKMRPGRLDAIARAFPELYLIGAHLGNPWWVEACGVAFKHARIFFDLSGGTAHRLSYARWRHLLMTAEEENLRCLDEKLDLGIVNKFVFGTDGPPVHYVLEFYTNLFDAFDFPPATRERILWRNVARMFGLEKELDARQAAGL
jgi:predicted TIM-barrel fold metal-dependent hydrolase